MVVNPDRELARIASDRDWEVRLFRIGVPLRERVPMPPPRLAAVVADNSRDRRRRCGRGLVVVETEQRPRRPPGLRGRRPLLSQESCSFFTAKAARASTTITTRSFFMTSELRTPAAVLHLLSELDGEEVAGAGVARRVAQLRHGAGLDLADALTGEVEVLADLFEGAGLAPVEAEAQLEDLALTLVERAEQPGDLLGQQRGGRHLEGRLGRAVLDDVAELGVAVLAERLGQRSGSAAKRRASVTLSSGISTSADSSASVAGRPSLSSSRARAFCSRASVSPAWTGRRMVRPVLAMPRVMAWRIHQVA